MAQSREAFIASLMPAAIQAYQQTGIDPRIIVAQAAQETGWGRSAPGNNYFGIKSHGQGGGQNFTTHEVIDGKRVKINDSFRAFGSPADSVAGYADFMSSNKRYQPMRQAQGLDAQLQALGQSGYATDPNYAQSVGAIARNIPISEQIAANQTGPINVASGGAAPALPAPINVGDHPVAAMGSMSPPSSAPVPDSIMASAQEKPATDKMGSMFSAMMMQPQQAPQPQPVQFNGPSPQQANALSSFIAALRQRMA